MPLGNELEGFSKRMGLFGYEEMSRARLWVLLSRFGLRGYFSAHKKEDMSLFVPVFVLIH